MLTENVPHCSFCHSTDVALLSPFGTAQLVRQYYCHACRSVFEFIRWQNQLESKEDCDNNSITCDSFRLG